MSSLSDAAVARLRAIIDQPPSDARYEIGELIGEGGMGSVYLALPIAIMNSNALHHNYYWQIMLPGSVVGLIVGYATQRYEPSRRSTVNA